MSRINLRRGDSFTIGIKLAPEYDTATFVSLDLESTYQPLNDLPLVLDGDTYRLEMSSTFTNGLPTRTPFQVSVTDTVFGVKKSATYELNLIGVTLGGSPLINEGLDIIITVNPIFQSQEIEQQLFAILKGDSVTDVSISGNNLVFEIENRPDVVVEVPALVEADQARDEAEIFRNQTEVLRDETSSLRDQTQLSEQQSALSATQSVSAAAGASQIVFQNIPTRPSRAPLFNFDFSGSGIADPRLTCVRSGSLATRVNRNGVIEVVPANTPRINFDPVTGQCLGLLVEPTRPNRFNPLVRSPFGILSATHVDGRRNTPMGTTTHCFGITTTSSDGRIINAVVLETTQRVCISIFLPKTSGNELISTRAEIVNSGNPVVPGSLHQFLFNQTTGVISNYFTGTNAGPASAILVEDYPTFGWWRLSVTFNVVVNASSVYQIQLNPRTSAGTPSAGLTLDYFGWSCEEIGVNDFGPSSYIHGLGTRGGEEIVLPSAVSGARGALALEISRVANNLSLGAIIGIQGSTAISPLFLVNSPNTGVATFRNLDGTNPNLDAIGVNNNTSVIRAFLSYSSTGRRLVVDNSAVATSASYAPITGVLTIGSANQSISPRGHIRKLAYWANPVADIEMVTWTQYNSFGTLGGQSASNSDLGTASKMDFNAIQRSPNRLDIPFLGTGTSQQRIFSLDFPSTLRLVHLPAGGTYSVTAGTAVVPETTVIPAGTSITVDFNVASNNILILAFLPQIQ